MAVLYAGSTILGGINSERARKGALAQGKFEAGMLEQNAKISELQAEDALAVGKEQQDRHMLEVRRLIGEQKTTIAGSGVDISSGTARDLMSDSAFLGELDRATIANNARREAWGYRVQAANYRNQATLAKLGSKNNAQSYRNQTYSTIIGGAAEIGSLYRNR